MARIEVVTIGDELVEGRLVDTNAGWISARPADEGLAVSRHTSVGDDPDDIVDVLREAASRASAVLVSGGLGPTTDDLTARCAAVAAGVEVVRHPEALEHVERFFAERGRTMSPNNAQQADLPAGCALLPNPRGTAVGFSVEIGGCRLWFMPGVPRELEAMVADLVLPAMRTRFAPETPMVATLKVFGKGESDVGQLLEGLGAGVGPPARLLVQYRATFPEIHVRLVLREGDEELLERLVEDARRRLGRQVFAVGGARCDDRFAEAVCGDLLRHRVRVAIAEGLTAGRVALLLAEAERSGEVLACSETRPFPPDLAAERASEVRDAHGATHGLAVTGDATSGSIRVAVATENGVATRELSFPIDVERLRTLAAYGALTLLRRAVTGEGRDRSAAGDRRQLDGRDAPR